MAKTTEEIANEMDAVNSIEEIMEILKKNNIGRQTFGDRLLELCAQYGVKTSELQKNVAVSKSQFYAALNGTREASKETVLKIAITLGVTPEEINELLKLAKHKELYVKYEEDAVILFGLKNKLDIYEIDNMLKKYRSKIRLLDEV